MLNFDVYRLSTYNVENEFNDWDLWCRKYVMLGILYFVDICKEEDIKTKLIDSLIKHADYILEHIGSDKKSILDTSLAWGAINSCTLLEPMVKLYNLTNDNKYLEFSKYIVSTGGCKDINLIEIALDNKLYPFEYPVTKAYEMMSFFDGVLELYSVTKEEYLKTASLNFLNKVLESDYSIIGSSGCTHELFDNSTITQSIEHNDVMQETCVTVTLMKLLHRALTLTFDSKYADYIERSYYNAFLGSINYNMNDELYWGEEYDFQFDYSPSRAFIKRIKGLTFDAYAPLYKDARNKKTGGYKLLRGNKCYGCCTCIGSLGVGLFPIDAAMQTRDGIAINQYFNESLIMYSPKGQKVEIEVKTDYPYDCKISLSIHAQYKEEFNIDFRIPDYIDEAIMNGETIEKGKYYRIRKEWNKDVINLEFKSHIYPQQFGNKIAVTNGLIVFAIDNRIDNIDKTATSNIESISYVKEDVPCNAEIEVKFSNDEIIKMVDYSSAGSNWYRGKNRITVFIDKE